ncbi:unnamed protein product [Victoria cruziana]
MDENTPSNASLNPSLIPPGATTATGAGTATTASPAPTMENTAQQQQQMPINQGQLLLAQGQLSGTPSEQTQQQQQQMLPSQAFQVQQGLASQQAAGAHLQRTSSAMSRINSAQFSMRPTIYTQQQAMGMNFSPHIQQQAGGTLSRSALMSQTGHLPMLPGQATQFTNLQSQLLSQPRQKALMQGSQFQSANPSGQQLQGMHPISMMGSLGLSSQLRPNGSLAYNQQRLGHGQIRPQQLSQQQSLTSPQKLQAQGLARPRSLASLNSQLSGLAQNGQPTMMQNSLSQQQWIKQIQTPISSPGSPSYHLNQQHRQALLQQQLSASQSSQKQPVTLNQQAVSQLVQQHQATQQQTLHHKQQSMQQQQPSPRTSGLGIQNSGNLIGSQPGTPASGMTTGGSASQGGETTTQLLGKRKIQDLVSQIDSNGKLDPEVEDILLELAHDFVDSVTTFACSLAKHRKSSTLDSKDILLHLEKNWQLTIPGFSSEEKKDHRKHITDLHQKRLAMIRKVMDTSGSETEAVKEMNNNPLVQQSIKASQSSETLFSPSSASPVLQSVPRF